MSIDAAQHPPHCQVHNKFHILGPNCIADQEAVNVDDNLMVIDETEALLQVADLAIQWSHAVREAVKREAAWQSHGGPLRKQAIDLEQQIHSLIFYYKLIPKEEASDEVEATTGESAI